jgi:uncharacterized protein (TIGR02145 family)
MKIRTNQPINRATKRSRLKILIPSLIGLALVIGFATGGFKALADMVAGFFVTEPVKELTAARGDGITSTSVVNVADPGAVDGYYLKAKLPTDISADFEVYIWSDDSTFCTNAGRCQLSTNDQIVYLNNTDSASVDSGDVITFKVNIASTNSAALDTPHEVDVEYTKVYINALQTFSTAKCTGMPVYPDSGSELIMKDTRDSKLYRVRKLADDNCWMVDNLAIQGPINLDGAASDMSDNSPAYALPEVTTPNGESYCANLNEATFPNKCGNYYTWVQTTTGYSGTTAPESICPKNWRLPSNYSSLRLALGWGDSGYNVNSSAWRGLYAGHSNNDAGIYGYYWTASRSSSNGYVLAYSVASVSPNNTTTITTPSSVRCLAR